ncbi:MAG: hypothetical protein DSY58_03440, partial [Desulfobulbus sp.]
MKFTLPKLSQRSLILIAAGILLYICLAAYYSSLKRHHPLVTHEQGVISHSESESSLLKQRLLSYKKEIEAARQETSELRKKLIAERQIVRQDQTPQMQTLLASSTKLQQELAQRNAAIKELQDKLSKQKIRIVTVSGQDRTNTAKLQEAQA